MLTLVKGNIFTAPTKVLVNTVNTVGVMGKGIAKTFRDIYPDMFREYQHLCEVGQFKVGNLWLYKTPNKWVLNFPTKQHWRAPSKLEYIEAGLEKFVSVYSRYGITSAAFPKLGCGNGGLDWEHQVAPLMMKYLNDLPIDIFIYDSKTVMEQLEHEDIKAMTAWLREEPHTLAFEEVWSDIIRSITVNSTLQAWDTQSCFQVKHVLKPYEGLSFQIGESSSLTKYLRTAIAHFTDYINSSWNLKLLASDTIFLPKETALDLWQNIRVYGYCDSKLIPPGLEEFGNYIFPVLSRLSYLKPVELTTEIVGNSGQERALQLYPLTASRIHQPQAELKAV